MLISRVIGAQFSRVIDSKGCGFVRFAAVLLSFLIAEYEFFLWCW